MEKSSIIQGNTDRKEDLISFESYFHIKKSYLLWIIIALAAFLRLYNFSGDSLWTDEIGTCWISGAPSLAETARRTVVTQGQSPFYYILEHLVISVLPVSEWSLRLLSLIAALFSVVLIFKMSYLIFEDNVKALAAALVFAINENLIYYGREARPYSLGLMFALLSMIYFIRITQRNTLRDGLIYTVSTILMCYCHYVFASILIVQNIYLVYEIFHRKNPIPGKISRWITAQVVTGISLLLLFGQIEGMFRNRSNWNWLSILPPEQAVIQFVGIFNPAVLLVLGLCFLIFVFIQHKENLLSNIISDKQGQIVLLGLWLIVPFLFVCIISYMLRISLFDTRYLVMSLLPFSIVLGNLLCVFRTSVLRIAFPGAYLLIYLGLVLIPDCIRTGIFSKRIGHNWKNAIEYVNINYEEGDAVLLRLGEIKENWIAMPENMSAQDYKIVCGYGRSPFEIFYWKGPDKIPVFSLTYSWNEDFYPYYDLIFEKLSGYKRVWLIGVNPPNTNYPISNINRLMTREYHWTEHKKMNFSGVSVDLLGSEPHPERTGD